MTEFAVSLPQELVHTLVELVHESMVVEPRFVSKTALADRLGVSERTIKTWRSKGLPGVPVGKTVMFEIAAVDRWIEQHA